jgi:hypothetical protein
MGPGFEKGRPANAGRVVDKPALALSTRLNRSSAARAESMASAARGGETCKAGGELRIPDQPRRLAQCAAHLLDLTRAGECPVTS